jgi:hypothetical protein
MSLGLIFWILMLVWLVFGIWWTWPAPAPQQSTAWHYAPLGSNVLLFILLLLLGWAIFGAPVKT